MTVNNKIFIILKHNIIIYCEVWIISKHAFSIKTVIINHYVLQHYPLLCLTVAKLTPPCPLGKVAFSWNYKLSLGVPGASSLAFLQLYTSANFPIGYNLPQGWGTFCTTSENKEEGGDGKGKEGWAPSIHAMLLFTNVCTSSTNVVGVYASTAVTGPVLRLKSHATVSPFFHLPHMWCYIFRETGHSFITNEGCLQICKRKDCFTAAWWVHIVQWY